MMLGRINGSDTTRRAIRKQQFKIKEMFPSEDNFAVVLVRFLAAFNDLQVMFECYQGCEYAGEQGEIKKDITLAKRCYFFRMTCGHLYEVLEILKKSINHQKEMKNQIKNIGEEGKQACERLMLIVNKQEKGFFKQLLLVRNHACFHYGLKNNELIQNALRDLKEEESSF
ncbi:MAG: hypothetical protein HYS56_04940, partial [Candidatus Omnitrophica bacterium]|nr:hypothetical protein [Candidatus Omnitrophota bacterium]